MASPDTGLEALGFGQGIVFEFIKILVLISLTKPEKNTAQDRGHDCRIPEGEPGIFHISDDEVGRYYKTNGRALSESASPPRVAGKTTCRMFFL